ncbi:hypothetical protein EV426DRAFT_704571 [Tirmania nivea]|nr:hypothetical protein EV426DRAFT_704571 [Tirmania nivea]
MDQQEARWQDGSWGKEDLGERRILEKGRSWGKEELWLAELTRDQLIANVWAASEVDPRGAAVVDVHSDRPRTAGRAEDPLCGLCERGIAQNAAHLLSCPGMADGRGRSWERIWEDAEWCEKLAEAVRR